MNTGLTVQMYERDYTQKDVSTADQSLIGLTPNERRRMRRKKVKHDANKYYNPVSKHEYESHTSGMRVVQFSGMHPLQYGQVYQSTTQPLESNVVLGNIAIQHQHL